MSGEAYEMPDGLLTMDAADAADAWYREVAALRSRVEALEGALRDIARPKYGLQGLIEDGADTEAICTYWSHLAGLYEQAARAALQPDKGEEEALRKVVEEHGAPTPVERPRPVNPMKRLSRQPDKGERCGGDGRLPGGIGTIIEPRGSTGVPVWFPCPGCPDCSEAP